MLIIALGNKRNIPDGFQLRAIVYVRCTYIFYFLSIAGQHNDGFTKAKVAKLIENFDGQSNAIQDKGS